MLINNYVSILCNKNNDNILCHNDLLKTYWQHRLFFYKTVEKSLFFNSIKFRIRDDIKENPSIIIRQQLFDKLFNYPNKVSEADFNTFFKLMYICL